MSSDSGIKAIHLEGTRTYAPKDLSPPITPEIAETPPNSATPLAERVPMEAKARLTPSSSNSPAIGLNGLSLSPSPERSHTQAIISEVLFRNREEDRTLVRTFLEQYASPLSKEEPERIEALLFPHSDPKCQEKKVSLKAFYESILKYLPASWVKYKHSHMHKMLTR